MFQLRTDCRPTVGTTSWKEKMRPSIQTVKSVLQRIALFGLILSAPQHDIRIVLSVSLLLQFCYHHHSLFYSSVFPFPRFLVAVLSPWPLLVPKNNKASLVCIDTYLNCEKCDSKQSAGQRRGERVQLGRSSLPAPLDSSVDNCK